jgi:hypothetical protein
MNRLRFPVAVLLIGLAAPASPRADNPTVSYDGPVSALRIPADAIGPAWTGPSGLAVDSLKDFGAQPPDIRPILEDLWKQLSPLGIVAAGDFTYHNRANARAELAVRVFLFDSEYSCREWWAKKFHAAGWERQYRIVSDVPYEAVDNIQSNKRSLMFGNVLITSGSIQDPDNEHLRAADLYVEKVQTAATGN